MRISKMLFFALLLTLVPVIAFAATQTVTTPAADVFGVMIIDDDGNCVSQTISHSTFGTIIDWTVNISRVNSDIGHIFTKNGSGNWIDSGRTIDLSGFDSASYTPDSAPVQNSSTAPWPTSTYIATQATLQSIPDSERFQSRCGPSGTYAGAGAYLDYKITRCYAFFTEGNYVYAELYYETVPVRRLYLPRKYFTHLYSIPSVTLTGYSAVLTNGVTARFGPGNHFDDLKEANLPSGLAITVFFEENGWVFAEFPSSIGVVRGWLPVNFVRAQ
ncbi:MAG: hypothetical protein E7331_12520 [Clostridiales bacterium]|nr:hypothetical protein [Clostridiales bacterium]